MDSFDMHRQCEDVPQPDGEMIIVDATTDGTDEEYRLVREGNCFFLEHWNPEKQEWNIIESLSSYELIQKVRS